MLYFLFAYVHSLSSVSLGTMFTSLIFVNPEQGIDICGHVTEIPRYLFSISKNVKTLQFFWTVWITENYFIQITLLFIFLLCSFLDIEMQSTAKSLQSCPTLCDPTDGSPPGSPVPGILHARTLEWVAISLSKGTKERKKVKLLSCVWPSTTL